MVFSEETNTLVLGEVSQRLHLPDDTVKRILHSLSCGKYKVLKREGQGGSIKAADKVCARERGRGGQATNLYAFLLPPLRPTTIPWLTPPLLPRESFVFVAPMPGPPRHAFSLPRRYSAAAPRFFIFWKPQKTTRSRYNHSRTGWVEVFSVNGGNYFVTMPPSPPPRLGDAIPPPLLCACVRSSPSTRRSTAPCASSASRWPRSRRATTPSEWRRTEGENARK